MSFFEKLKKGMGVEAPAEEPASAEATVDKGKKKKTEKLKVEVKPVETKEEKPSFASSSAKATEDKKAPESKEKEPPKKTWPEPEGQLAIDVYQTDEELVIQSAIAGIKLENLDISIENDVVTITGSREEPNPEEKKNYFYQECYWGPFSRQIILPEEVDGSRAEAKMKDGILTLRMPKIQRKKKRKIEIKTF